MTLGSGLSEIFNHGVHLSQGLVGDVKSLVVVHFWLGFDHGRDGTDGDSWQCTVVNIK